MLLRLSLALSMVALLVLGGLQYHWIGQITVAERQRLERDAAESSLRFAEDLSSELRSVALALEPPGAPMDPESVAQRYRSWMSDAAYPGILKSVYIARYPDDVQLLDSVTGAFAPASWPPHLAEMKDFVANRGRAPIDLPADSFLIRNIARFQGGRGGGRGGQQGFGGGGPTFGAVFGGAPGDGPGAENDETWVVGELNHDLLVSEILPTLIARRFPEAEGRNYRVAVTTANRLSGPETVFTSGGAWSERDLETADFQLDLFTPPIRRGGPGGPPDGRDNPRDGLRDVQRDVNREGARGADRGLRIGERGRNGDARNFGMGFTGQRWRLLVKHPAGSLDTAAADFRTRNLAISFGVLVVLGVGAAAIGVSANRAHRLGKLQMQFAAGISHELRTPLAVIQAAAHNLGAGVVQDREGIEEYAGLVQTEARRLGDMVDQVLTYTETQSGKKRYDLAPVDLTDIADNALRNMTTVLRESGATVESCLDPNLPPVVADAPALMRCLQNLISNAAKYGRQDEPARIRIDGAFIPESGGPGRVELNVSDNGPGVPEADARHLFEAFHRGSNASTNTPGNGLGLHLVHRMMAAQKGSVTYSPAERGGARFTLSLPVASPS